MPIFEYRCEECGHGFDAFFRRAEDADKREFVCAKCGSGRIRKLFSVIGTPGMSRESQRDSCGTRST